MINCRKNCITNWLFSFSHVNFLNVTVGEGDAVMNIDVLESCSAAEMFSDCRRSSEGAEGFAVASTCDWTQSEWGRRSGEFIRSNSCVFQIGISRRVDHGLPQMFVKAMR